MHHLLLVLAVVPLALRLVAAALIAWITQLAGLPQKARLIQFSGGRPRSAAEAPARPA
jgi:hypothetical protein